MRYEQHDFYCLKCGKRGIPLPREKGRNHEKFHRKRLYCLNCKEEVNHIECRTYNEIEQFKEDFKNGVYVNEAEESVSFVRGSWIGKINIC